MPTRIFSYTTDHIFTTKILVRKTRS